MKTKSLDKAIDLHEEHMRNPKTATTASQQKLMDLLMAHKKEMLNRYTIMGGVPDANHSEYAPASV